MREAIHDYLQYLASLNRSGDTIKAYSLRLKSFRVFLHGQKVKELRNLSLRHVRAWHDSLIENKLKTGSRVAYLSSIACFLEWAHQHKLTLTNLSVQIELPAKEKTLPPTPLSEEDIKNLFELVPGTDVTGKRNRAILEVFYGCGLRFSEVLNLNIGDIDAVEETVFVRSGKGDKDRIVPINPTALHAIADYLQARGGRPKKSSPLFITHGTAKEQSGARLPKEALRRFFWKLNKKFGRHLYPHLFRHTFACHLLANGADILYIKALLGHDSAEVTGKYLGLQKREVKQAYDNAIEQLWKG